MIYVYNNIISTCLMGRKRGKTWGIQRFIQCFDFYCLWTSLLPWSRSGG